MQFDIKEYIARAKELEVAIYKQKELKKAHYNYLLMKRPIAPIKKEVTIPPAVSFQQPQKRRLGFDWWLYLSGCFTLPWYGFSLGVGTGFFLICGFVCVCLCVYGYMSREKEYEKAVEAYNDAVNSYDANVRNARVNQSYIDHKYSNDIAIYNEQIAECKAREEEAMMPHSDCLHNLETALEEHYAMNMLFEKYRNLVAVTTIDEYLQSGRCDTLEGAEGAYNLYEMELRQNIVIGQLSAVLRNMEQIKNNQYTLYHELAKVNAGVTEIMADIKTLNSTAKLNAYFAGVSAQIAAAPKYIHGHIY